MFRNTILVTGAAGLIGLAVVKKLLSMGKKVIACDNSTITEWKEESSNLMWINADISSPNFIEQLKDYSIGAVVHCAAHPGGKSLKEPAIDVKVNAYGSMVLFEWCARNKVYVVYLSSSVVYGNQPQGRISETALVQPGTIYGICKVACENFLKILGEGYGLEWTVLRLFATYGAGHKPSTFQGIVNIMLTQLLTGNQVVVKGPLRRQRDLLYVDDAAEVIVSCLSEPSVKSQILNVGTGIPTNIEDLIKMLCKALGRKFSELIVIEQEGIVGDPLYNVADCQKINQILNFQPQYSLERGLKEIVKIKDLNH